MPTLPHILRRCDYDCKLILGDLTYQNMGDYRGTSRCSSEKHKFCSPKPFCNASQGGDMDKYSFSRSTYYTKHDKHFYLVEG